MFIVRRQTVTYVSFTHTSLQYVDSFLLSMMCYIIFQCLFGYFIITANLISLKKYCHNINLLSFLSTVFVSQFCSFYLCQKFNSCNSALNGVASTGSSSPSSDSLHSCYSHGDGNLKIAACSSTISYYGFHLFVSKPFFHRTQRYIITTHIFPVADTKVTLQAKRVPLKHKQEICCFS